MKRLGLLLMSAILFFGLVACGSDTEVLIVKETVYQEIPQVEVGAKINITSSSTQQIQLHVNSDGTLAELESGSYRVYPEDVERIVFSSDRVGRYENSRVFGSIGADLKVPFNDLLNNDSGLFVAILFDGRQHQVIPAETALTFKEMNYHVDADGWYQYGDQAESFAEMFFAPDGTVTIGLFARAETFFGLAENVYRNDWVWAKFVTTDGKVYYTDVRRSEKSGNVSFSLGGITLPPMDMYQYMTTVGGKIFVVAADGTEVEVNFDWKKLDWSWYIGSSTNGLYQSFNEETGDVEIQYYPPYQAIEY